MFFIKFEKRQEIEPCGVRGHQVLRPGGDTGKEGKATGPIKTQKTA